MSEVFIECWHCHTQVTLAERSDEDGFCPHCASELDLDDYLEQSVAAIDAIRADNKRLEGEVERLREALEIVSQWRLPKTGQVWPSGGEVSYGACYGSNGERDYMKGIAKSALPTTANGEVSE